MRMLQKRMLPNGEEVVSLTASYYQDNSGAIRRRNPKVKGKAAHKTQKMQRIWDRTFPTKDK